MEIKNLTPNQTLLEIISQTIDMDIDKALSLCNKWQESRMESEKLVFGKSITRLLTEADIRQARAFIYKQRNKK